MAYTITREDGITDALAVQEAINLLIEDHPNDKLSIIARLRELRDSIEEQVKPAIEEPKENFTVIRAVPAFDDRPRELVLLDGHWCDLDANPCGDWESFTGVKVLRVGIGENHLKPFFDGVAEGRVRRFCSLSKNCRMADGHDGGCQP